MLLYTKYRILTADIDLNFQRQLSRILKNIIADYKHTNVELFAETDVQKINEQVKSKLDLVFLDKVDKNIMKVIDTFKKHNQLYFGEHLLKDNYSDDIMSFFYRVYIDRIVYH